MLEYARLVQAGQLPSTNETYFLPHRVFYDAMSFVTTIEVSTVTYLTALPKGEKHLSVLANFTKGLPKRAAPVRTTGDGNCLLHALSRALWGVEWYHEILRKLLQTELTEHEEFYKHAVDKPHEAEDPNKKEDEKEEEFCYTDEDYKEFVFQAGQPRERLGFIHVFALSNIIKRPIFVYASEQDMHDWGVHEQGIAGLFLPTRHGASSCQGGPLAISWSDDCHGHYVPLCPVELEEGETPFEWPRLEAVFKKTLKDETPDDYFTTDQIGKENDRGLGRMIEEMMSGNTSSFASELKRIQKQRKEQERKMKELLEKKKKEDGTSKIKHIPLPGLGIVLTVRDDDLVDVEEMEEEDDDTGGIEMYDVVRPLRISGKDYEIGFNLTSNPYEVARDFLMRERLPLKFADHIEKFVRDSQLVVKSHPEKYINQKKTIRREAHSKAIPTRTPSVTSDVIPYTKHPNIFAQVNENMATHFLKINAEMRASNPRLAMSDVEVVIFTEMCKVLVMFKNDLKSTTFSEEALQLMKKLLTWPVAHLSTVIDVLRVLILHKHAAEYFLATEKKEDKQHPLAFLFGLSSGGEDKGKTLQNTIFLQVLQITVRNKPLDFKIGYSIMRFIANLFHHIELRPFLLHFQSNIMQVVRDIVDDMQYEQKEREGLVSIVSYILLNFANVWRTDKGHRSLYHEASRKALSLTLTILSDYGHASKIVSTSLLALGTMLVTDSELLVEKTSWENLRRKFPDVEEIKNNADYISLLLS